MTFKRVLAGSSLNKTELATLYGVSRQTIDTWSKGGLPREGSYTDRMAQVISSALCNAMDRKILPFGAISREVRKARIMRMTKMVQSLKPAPK